jgi:hypothetical protein
MGNVLPSIFINYFSPSKSFLNRGYWSRGDQMGLTRIDEADMSAGMDSNISS